MPFPVNIKPGSWSFVFFLSEIKYEISPKVTKNQKLTTQSNDIGFFVTFGDYLYFKLTFLSITHFSGYFTSEYSTSFSFEGSIIINSDLFNSKNGGQFHPDF
jgi:hypothetical protein